MSVVQDVASNLNGNSFEAIQIKVERVEDDDSRDDLDSETNVLPEETVACTLCKKRLPLNKPRYFAHPDLNVILCKYCYGKVSNATFVKGADGGFKLCRWCGQGGKLFCCDHCPNVFHTECIKENVTEEKFKDISSSTKWACFVCDPSPIKDAVRICENAMKFKESILPKKTRKSFLPPNKNMTPKIALGRCIENANIVLKELKTVILDFRRKLVKCNTPNEMKEISERFLNVMVLVNENNSEITRSVKNVVENIETPSCSKNSSTNLDVVDDLKLTESDDEQAIDIPSASSKICANSNSVQDSNKVRDCTLTVDSNENLVLKSDESSALGSSDNSLDGAVISQIDEDDKSADTDEKELQLKKNTDAPLEEIVTTSNKNKLCPVEAVSETLTAGDSAAETDQCNLSVEDSNIEKDSEETVCINKADTDDEDDNEIKNIKEFVKKGRKSKNSPKVKETVESKSSDKGPRPRVRSDNANISDDDDNKIEVEVEKLKSSDKGPKPRQRVRSGNASASDADENKIEIEVEKPKSSDKGPKPRRVRSGNASASDADENKIEIEVEKPKSSDKGPKLRQRVRSGNASASDADENKIEIEVEKPKSSDKDPKPRQRVKSGNASASDADENKVEIVVEKPETSTISNEEDDCFSPESRKIDLKDFLPAECEIDINCSDDLDLLNFEPLVKPEEANNCHWEEESLHNYTKALEQNTSTPEKTTESVKDSLESDAAADSTFDESQQENVTIPLDEISSKVTENRKADMLAKDEKNKTSTLRLSLKKLSPITSADGPSDADPEGLNSEKGHSSKRVLSLKGRIVLSDNENDDDGDQNENLSALNPAEQANLRARDKILNMSSDEDNNELDADVSAHEPKNSRSKSKKSDVKTEEKCKDKSVVSSVSTDKPHTKLSKRDKLQRILEGKDDSLTLRSRKSDDVKSPRKTRLSRKVPSLDDLKLKMQTKIVLQQMSQVELNFNFENGYNAWKKRFRSTELHSSDDEFMRAVDFKNLRKKKLRKRSVNADEITDDEKHSSASEKPKKPLVKKAKQNKFDALSALNESSEEQTEDEGSWSKPKPTTISSSDSESVIKSANELARDRILRMSTTDEDDDDEKSEKDDAEKSEKDDEEESEKDDDESDKKISKKSKKTLDDSDNDFIPINRKKRLRSKFNMSDSDSEGKKRNLRGKSTESSKGGRSDSSVASGNSRKRKAKELGSKKKRRRIKVASSTDSSVEELSADDLHGTPSGKGRKNIRKLISDRKLTSDTKFATREEDERRKRVAELQKKYNEVFDDPANDIGVRVTKKLVLAADPKTNEVLEINENIICKLKPHQVEGVKFMWECTGESLERLDEYEGSGCILAHCMGLGKTLQVITFLHTVLTRERGNLKTALVVCPLNTVLNWHRECIHWLDDVHPMILILEMSGVKTHKDRINVLKNWRTDGGILIMGYDNFRNITQENNKRIPKFYREIFQTSLINPGPDIVVCDEGHILKNAATGISKAMVRINTKRRIILTGTPLQNNLTEYHCMVNFVKQNLLGTMKEFQNRFVNPIHNGQCNDSTAIDVRIMKNRAHILHNLLDGCVQRRDYNVLTPFLPPKHEYVIGIRLTDIQIKLYSFYLNNLCSGLHGKGQLFSDYQNLMKIWTHPRVIRLAEIRQENKILKSKSQGTIVGNGTGVVASANPCNLSFPSKMHTINESNDSFIDDDTDSTSSDSKSVILDDDSNEPGTSKKTINISDGEGDVVNNWKTRSRSKNMPDEEVQILEKDVEDAQVNTWWSDIISEEDAKKVEHSGKLLILLDILRQCEEIGDKVLVFSQSLLSLDFIEAIVNGSGVVDGETLPISTQMIRGLDYFRLDGSTNADLRSKFIRMFNDENNMRARLFLISTKAGSLGINLVAANRVVIFDASWNPTHDIQSIFRVYRFGQKKPVYIYRLVAQGTMEEKIYDRQVAKQSLACRVIDEQQIERHYSFADLQALYTFEPNIIRNRPTPVLPKDKLLADLLVSKKDLITSYHEHDSLLVNQAEEELTEEERKAAWVEFEFERTPLNRDIGFKFDVSNIIQEIQKQQPGLGIKDLTAKVRDLLTRMEEQAKERAIQKQQELMQNRLLMQQQQALRQAQFAAANMSAYQNQSNNIQQPSNLHQQPNNLHQRGQIEPNHLPHMNNLTGFKNLLATFSNVSQDKPFP